MVEDHDKKERGQAAGNGRTFTDILRGITVRHPMTGLKVFAVLFVLTAISGAFLPAQSFMVPVALIGTPLTVWLIQRDQKRWDAPGKRKPR